AAAVGQTQNTEIAAPAVPLAECRRLVTSELLPELRIHRLRAAEDSFSWQVVVLCEFVDKRVLTGQIVWKDVPGFGARQFVDRVARCGETIAEVRARIELPDTAPNVRLGKIHGILDQGTRGQQISVTCEMHGHRRSIAEWSAVSPYHPCFHVSRISRQR